VLDEASSELLGQFGHDDRVKDRDRHSRRRPRDVKALIADAPLTNAVNADADRRLTQEIDTLFSEVYEPWTRHDPK
jgi:hypothetical protein